MYVTDFSAVCIHGSFIFQLTANHTLVAFYVAAVFGCFVVRIHRVLYVAFAIYKRPNLRIVYIRAARYVEYRITAVYNIFRRCHNTRTANGTYRAHFRFILNVAQITAVRLNVFKHPVLTASTFVRFHVNRTARGSKFFDDCIAEVVFIGNSRSHINVFTAFTAIHFHDDAVQTAFRIPRQGNNVLIISMRFHRFRIVIAVLIKVNRGSFATVVFYAVALTVRVYVVNFVAVVVHLSHVDGYTALANFLFYSVTVFVIVVEVDVSMLCNRVRFFINNHTVCFHGQATRLITAFSVAFFRLTFADRVINVRFFNFGFFAFRLAGGCTAHAISV